jgi:hypothetical protein
MHLDFSMVLVGAGILEQGPPGMDLSGGGPGAHTARQEQTAF